MTIERPFQPKLLYDSVILPAPSSLYCHKTLLQRAQAIDVQQMYIPFWGGTAAGMLVVAVISVTVHLQQRP